MKLKIKGNITLIVLSFLLVASCKDRLTDDYEMFKYFDIYEVRGNFKIEKNTSLHDRHVLVKEKKDTIFVKVKNQDCYYDEIFTKKNNKWESFKSIEPITKGKLIKNNGNEYYKLIYNDTILIFSSGLKNYDFEYKFLPYKNLRVITKNKEINFVGSIEGDSFDLPNHKLKKEDLDILKENSIYFELISKHFTENNLYLDIIRKHKKKDKSYTVVYEINEASEYFLLVDECNLFKSRILKYKERLSADDIALAFNEAGYKATVPRSRNTCCSY